MIVTFSENSASNHFLKEEINDIKQATKMTLSLQFLTKEHRSTVMLFITVVGGLLTYLPMTTKSNLEESLVGDALRHGPLFRIGIVASISLATPFFMNNLADVIVNFFEAKKLSKQTQTAAPRNNNTPMLSTYEKLFFISGILMVPIVSCFTQWNSAILMIACTVCAQKHVVYGTVLTSLNRFSNRYFPTSLSYFLLFISALGSIVRAFTINASASVSPADSSILCGGVFIKYGTLIAYTALVLMILFWLSSVVVTRLYGEEVCAQYYRWPTWCGRIEMTASNATHAPRVEVNAKKATGPPDKSDNGFLLSFRVIYVLAVIAWGTFVIINAFFVSAGYSFTHFNDKALLLNCIPYIVFELTGVFFALRLVKHQSVSALFALLDAKRRT